MRTKRIDGGVQSAPSVRTVVRRPAQLLRRPRQATLYVIVGAWNTAFGYTEWAILQFLLQGRLHYLAILVISWPAAVLMAYACYRRIVFRSTGNVWQELPRFSLVYAMTLVGSLVALPFLLHTLTLSIYLVQGGYTIIAVIVTYLAHRVFSFRQPRHPSRDPRG